MSPSEVVAKKDICCEKCNIGVLLNLFMKFAIWGKELEPEVACKDAIITIQSMMDGLKFRDSFVKEACNYVDKYKMSIM